MIYPKLRVILYYYCMGTLCMLKRLFFITFLLSLSRFNTQASVIWLELGKRGSPAINANGNALTENDLPDLTFTVYDEQQRLLGVADVSSLDLVEKGYFVGIIYLGDSASGAISMKVLNSSKSRFSDLGTGQAWDNDFSPYVDPSIHKITAPDMVWHDAIFFSLNADTVGFGEISSINGEYLSSTAITINSVAANRFEFVEWLGDVPLVDKFSPTITLILDRSRSISARFGRIVPSEWKLTHFGTAEIDLEADPDEDSLSTRMEFEMGTDPNDGSQLTIERIVLDPGWNLISFPVQPDPKATLNAKLGGKLKGNPWIWNGWEGRFDVETQIMTKQGCWIYVSSPTTELEVIGQQVIDNSLLLFKGWNLVGPAKVKSIKNYDTISDILWGWDPIRKQFVVNSKSDPLKSKTAYWIYANGDTLLSN